MDTPCEHQWTPVEGRVGTYGCNLCEATGWKNVVTGKIRAHREPRPRDIPRALRLTRVPYDRRYPRADKLDDAIAAGDTDCPGTRRWKDKP